MRPGVAVVAVGVSGWAPLLSSAPSLSSSWDPGPPARGRGGRGGRGRSSGAEHDSGPSCHHGNPVA